MSLTNNNKNKFNWYLFVSVLLMMLLPSIYNTLRIYWLGEIPAATGVNIASQFAYLDVLFEVMREALILPLFYIIGKSLNSPKELENKVRSGLVISFGSYALLSVFIWIGIDNLLLLIHQKQELLDDTKIYIRLEVIALSLSIVPLFLNVILVSLNRYKAIIKLLSLEVVSSIILDIFLLSNWDVSLQLGVNGIALSNIVKYSLLIIYSIYLLKESGINVLSRRKMSFGWIKDWFSVGSISGLESLIRNMFFITMILRMVNMVEEQGTYWLTNNFIWGWLLLPVLALGEVIKKNISEENNSFKEEFKQGIKLTSIFVVSWIITIPLWETFLSKIMNVSNADDVKRLALAMLGFYIIFAYNNVVDSIFYGLGRTDLMLWQSIFTNILVYGIAFILYMTGVWIPTLMSISILFGIGISVDSLITFIMYIKLSRNSKNRPPSLPG